MFGVDEPGGASIMRPWPPCTTLPLMRLRAMKNPGIDISGAGIGANERSSVGGFPDSVRANEPSGCTVR
jgi:hypothetical protein